MALDSSLPKYVTIITFQYPHFVCHDSRLKTTKFTGYQEVFAHVLTNRQSTEKHNMYQLLYIYSIPPDDGLQICPIHVEVD